MNLRAHIVHLLTSHRLPLSDEKQLQEAIATVFANDGLYFRREHRLAEGDIVDFLVLNQAEPPICGVAVEVKIKGSRRDIFRQVERYCGHPCVHGMVLATNVPMSLPSPICGKHVSVAHLGRGWL